MQNYPLVQQLKYFEPDLIKKYVRAFINSWSINVCLAPNSLEKKENHSNLSRIKC